jgi:hypothetical protein
MRPGSGIGAAALLVVLASQAHAEGTSYSATIKVPDAEVRSGHGTGPELYATNRLKYGDTVEVTRELDDGWLEIKPPARSFSWINARMVEPLSGNVWAVKGEPGQAVSVLYGSALRDAKPTVEATKVPFGSQVVSIGKKMAADDGMWLPIEPPPSERRYVLATAVARPSGGTKTPSAPPAPIYDNPGVKTSLPAQPTEGPSVTIAEAQKAESAGDYGTASRLWEELAKTYAKTNYDMALNCHEHSLYLRDRISAVAGGRLGQPDNRFRPLPASTNCYPASSVPCAPPNTSRSYSVNGAADPGRDSPPPPQSDKNVGRLRSAGWAIDNRKTYRLETSDGRPLMYVLPQLNLDLEPFVGKNVELQGAVEYRTAVRAHCLLATAVNPLP